MVFFGSISPQKVETSISLTSQYLQQYQYIGFNDHLTNYKIKRGKTYFRITSGNIFLTAFLATILSQYLAIRLYLYDSMTQLLSSFWLRYQCSRGLFLAMWSCHLQEVIFGLNSTISNLQPMQQFVGRLEAVLHIPSYSLVRWRITRRTSQWNYYQSLDSLEFL